VVTTVEGNGELGASKVLGGGTIDCHDLPGC
jgi:hypothetical protein